MGKFNAESKNNNKYVLIRVDYSARETVYGSERALNYESGESLGTAGNILQIVQKMIYIICLPTEKKQLKLS